MPEHTGHDEGVARNIPYYNPIRFFLMGLLWGTLIGGVLALLYAPMKGSETRQLVRDKAEDAARLVQTKAEEIRETAIDVAEDVRGKAAETRKRGEEILKSVREG